MKQKPRVLFLSHGGGPLPLLGDPGHKEMIDHLKRLGRTLTRPSAIIVISAHWEENPPTITSAANPPLIYDYYGFPEEAYRITYPCPGEPELAHQVKQLLEKSGIESRLNGNRGFDHGLFVPLKIMYPDAGIPCIQLSLNSNLNPADHIKMGKALTDIQWDDLLVVGSGLSFHNVQAAFSAPTAESINSHARFEAWLIDTLSNTALDESDRTRRLAQWEQAPAARYCHPREEHLLPLHVCYGVAQAPCTAYFELTIMNKKVSDYLW